MVKKLSMVWMARRTAMLATCATLVAASAQPLLAQDGGDSPAAVYAAAQKAAAQKDVSGIVRLVAPSERAMLAFSTDMGVSMVAEMWKGESAEKVKTRYAELRKKYKVPDDVEGEELQVGPDTPQAEIDVHIQKRAEKMFAGVDVVGYVGEIMALVLEMPEMAGRPLMPPEELADLKVEGDKARAKAGEREMSFVKEGGRWYLSSDVIGG
jgi:hypothetical protein